MEDTLRASSNTQSAEVTSLNPCFNGRYSQSIKRVDTPQKNKVLILVLMEDTLRGEERCITSV